MRDLIVQPTVEANQFPTVGDAVLLTESGKAGSTPAIEPTEAVHPTEPVSKILVAK